MANKYMQRSALVTTVGILLFGIGAAAQNTTSLVLRVRPEASIDPKAVSIPFHISANGQSDIAKARVQIGAAARALPDQHILVTARLVELNGPNGPVSTPLAWRSTKVMGTTGAEQASCSDGYFTTGSTADVVKGWLRSGRVTCAAVFELAEPADLVPGFYVARILFSVETR